MVKVATVYSGNDWKGQEWNIALKMQDYGITDIQSCMDKACMPYSECVGVTVSLSHPSDVNNYCHPWDTCDFSKLEGGAPYLTQEKPSPSVDYTLFIPFKLQLREICYYYYYITGTHWV